MTEPEARSDLVSVVIPSYNHRRFVGRAIDSVLAQTHRSIEVVVVDDGSTDDSVAFLRDRYGSDARVRLVARENRGADATLNEAIGLARGRYVAILNSDDEYRPTRIARLVAAAARKAPDAYFGFTGLEVVDDDGAHAPDTVPGEYYLAIEERMVGEPVEASFWVGNYAMTTSNFFFSRAIFDEVGGFAKLRYTHDWDFALRVVARYGVERIDEPLLLYRVHGGNTISERAAWRKRAENAYVFASLLRRETLESMAKAAGVTPTDVMRALCKNPGFLPVPTVYLLALSSSDDALAGALASGEIERALRQLVERDGFREELFESAARIDATMDREDHLGRLLWHWRPVRRVRKVLRGVRRDARARARKLRTRLRGPDEGSD